MGEPDVPEHSPADEGDVPRMCLEAWVCPQHGIVNEDDLIEGLKHDTYLCGHDCGHYAHLTQLVPRDPPTERTKA